MFQLNKIFSVSLPQNILPRTAMSEAYNKFSPYDAVLGDFLSHQIGSWSKESNPWMHWEASHVVDGIKYQGAWTKRANKLYKRLHGKEIDEKLLSELGGFLGGFKKEMSYLCKISSIFDWKPGDFAERDNGSCWWDSKPNNRVGLAARETARVVLFYKDQAQYDEFEGKRGIGRSWMLDYDDKAFIFNAYGVSLSDTANILASEYKLQFKKIFITSKGAYLNMGNYNNLERQGGNIGLSYVLAHDVTGYPTEPDYPTVVESFAESPAICHCCKKAYSPHDLKLIGYEILCQECIADKYPQCEVCGKNVSHVQKVWYNKTVRICDPCFKRYELHLPSHQCSVHGTTFGNTYRAWHTNKRYCDTCKKEGKFIQCRGCGKTVNQYVKLQTNPEMPDIGHPLCIPCSKTLIKNIKEMRYGDLH